MDLLILLLFGAISLMLFVGFWALLAYRKLYGHYFNFWILLFIVLIPAGAQEDIPVLEDPFFAEPDPTGIIEIPIDPGPLVFPEEMPKAAEVVEQIITDIFCPQCNAEEDAVQAKMLAFLGNDTSNLSINFTA